ncbi:SDR family oxidoreductase [Thiohalocapsa marina]|uniref:SDR family oxidoreductase n=1 Tax=Thiohalocapsa marina TaxID=424902 RepID=A0A5M8FKG1_9GAMM|nr:SDR family oxidoreductase [Thiohalocapsa marina]KAA6183671.1 SDR family oxidoreductase [Thiohalocapsa marina]
MPDFTDRVAVITGASRGLGAGLARSFLQHGLRVAVCARTAPDCGTHGDRCLSRALDVTDSQAVDAFCAESARQFGPIDLWINNAGLLAPIGPLHEVDPDDFRRHIEVNVLGVFNGSRAFIRHRLQGINAQTQAAAGGVLINISSGAARNAYAGWSAYCAGKAAVDRMSESIALEQAEHGLRVHAVAPGIVDTDMQAEIRRCSPEQFPMVQKFLDLKQADSFSTPAFVAERLLELAFDPAHRRDEVLISLPRPS